MLDHSQGVSGVAAGDHRHIAAAFTHRGLINQQHFAALLAAMRGDQPRPGPHQRVDDTPTHTVTAHHATDRHLLRVGDQPMRQPACQPPVEAAVVLYEPLAAVTATEPAPRPHQRRCPTRHLQVAHLALTCVMNLVALEPAMPAPDPRPGRLDPHSQHSRSVNQHLNHTNLTQTQPHPHNINSHRGPPGS